LDESQFRALKKLKKDLEKQRRAKDLPPRGERHSPILDLFDRLATSEEGIESLVGGTWVPVPLGPDDRRLFELMTTMAEHCHRRLKENPETIE
jgi:hypothetical protein